MPAFNQVDLTTNYLTAIRDYMSNAEQINAAISIRGIIIEDPARKGKSGNDATLASIQQQFGKDGNRLPDATFAYHEPERREREKNRFLSDNLTDREQIALASVYFAAGVSATNQHAGNKAALNLLDALQVVVANELRGTTFFAPAAAQGYTVNPAVITKIQTMLDNAPQLTQAASSDARWKETLQGEFYKLSLQKQSILKQAGTMKPQELKGKEAEKFKIISNMITAIDKFGQNYDLKELANVLTIAAQQDNQRQKGFIGTHHTSKLIQQTSNLVRQEMKNRATSGVATVHADWQHQPSPSSVNPTRMFSVSKVQHQSMTEPSTPAPSEPPSPRRSK